MPFQIIGVKEDCKARDQQGETGSEREGRKEGWREVGRKSGRASEKERERQSESRDKREREREREKERQEKRTGKLVHTCDKPVKKSEEAAATANSRIKICGSSFKDHVGLPSR